MCASRDAYTKNKSQRTYAIKICDVMSQDLGESRNTISSEAAKFALDGVGTFSLLFSQFPKIVGGSPERERELVASSRVATRSERFKSHSRTRESPMMMIYISRMIIIRAASSFRLRRRTGCTVKSGSCFHGAAERKIVFIDRFVHCVSTPLLLEAP